MRETEREGQRKESAVRKIERRKVESEAELDVMCGERDFMSVGSHRIAE
jgi:hypothetical protein